ncbi:hypothetical protein, partial [Bacteroides heparinolyticus]|uniref:hypothetical protein n=1 Tax=Prevotella heparinolytica TaxID=28113 RepID=UPI0035A149CF
MIIAWLLPIYGECLSCCRRVFPSLLAMKDIFGEKEWQKWKIFSVKRSGRSGRYFRRLRRKEHIRDIAE